MKYIYKYIYKENETNNTYANYKRVFRMLNKF